MTQRLHIVDDEDAADARGFADRFCAYGPIAVGQRSEAVADGTSYGYANGRHISAGSRIQVPFERIVEAAEFMVSVFLDRVGLQTAIGSQRKARVGTSDVRDQR